MSYGPSLINASRLIGIYSEKYSRVNPAELPVEQNTKIEFVINLKRRRRRVWNSPYRC